MPFKLSRHIESMIESPIGSKENEEFLRGILPQIKQLEDRADRIENRHRNLRLRYNAIKKAVEVVRAVTNDSMLNPYSPENLDDD